MLPIAVRSTTAARSSLKRLEEFYNLPEIDTPKLPLRTPEDEPTLCMRINGACFSWDGDLEHPHITDLSLDLHRGKIYGVVGDVGSGKSLLAGIMGQLKLKKGSVDIYYKKMDPSQPLKTSNISSPIGDISSSDVEMDNLNEPNQYNDSVEDLGEIIEEEVVEKFKFGYVPQEPWEIDASIRDNIIFGEEWDEQKYSEVVRTCGLLRDIMLLSNGKQILFFSLIFVGDLTNVTELNLSNNSQRQRLSLARCLYHEPDMVLLEDCLGDFDSSSAKTLFSELVKGYMLKRNKCVIYFTNQKQFLTHCDLILVLKAGTVIEKGTYLELKNKHVNFSTYVSDYSPIEDDPTGLLDTVNELRFLSGGGNKQLISKKNNSLLRSIRSPSPLATAKVITNAEVSEVASADDQTENDYHQLNQSTIKSLKSQNPYSVQMNSLSEQAISKIIEKNQLSILTGNPNQSQRKPPTNFTNQDIVSSMIQQNSLTVLSEFDMDIGFGMENSGGESLEDGTTDRKDRYYDLYLKEKTGRSLGLLVIFSFFLVSGLRFASDYWLGLIVSHFQATKNRALTFDFAIYGGFSALILFGVLFRGFAFSASIVLKSVSLHDRVIKAILRAPISFYDVTPIGQILSNFYRHLYLIDDTLPEGWLQVLSFSPVLFGTVILVSLVVPWFWLTLPIYFFFGILLVFKCSQLEQKLKVLEASNKSPMFSHLSSTLEGLFSIRLYQTEKRFTAFNQTLIDADHKVLYSLMAVRSLQALYIDFIACIFIYITCLFCLLFNVEDVYTGLSVSNSLQLLLFVQWLIRVSGEVNSTMSSVSSVVYFGKHCPAEAPSVIPENRPPKSWPQSGKIEFKNVVLKYNRFGVAVLKSVSFKINSGEKIGIVGRSGSGKTTILVSLMRMTELAEGQIYVDGIDISSIGLKDLRSRIAVIPQEPVLLTGTIRSNLDPFGKCSDEQVWKSLHGVHLATKIKEMPAKLDTSVIENGKAFTIAERQLFCIARAILLETKILVFDEPLVSVDTETDKLIQQTISENFSDHTVIVLASRFNLIMESDKIMVMDGGKIVEFDTPLTLLDAPRSRFLKMIAQTGGDADLIKLRKIAVKQNEKRKLNLKLSKSPSLHVPPPISKTNSQTSSISDTSNESKMPKSLEGIFLKEDSNNKSESISTSLSNIAAVDSLSSLDNQATSTTNLLNNH
ncbi:hypothetical protein HK099_008369 [Clydaea vesicula]|uniref:Uncharacterized protein n=1 Tax=Clydaea vesicula TaxID=447962 RepID=A0AAD5U4V9_9FUNG|nr:hypothetical protein HK099_008369 [Clydaea vesicula]